MENMSVRWLFILGSFLLLTASLPASAQEDSALAEYAAEAEDLAAAKEDENTDIGSEDLQPELKAVEFSIPKVPPSTTAMSRRPPLWKVETGTNTIYFFGSVHALSRRFSYPDAVQEAYNDAEVVAVETTFNSININEEDAFFKKYVLLTPGWKLYDLVHPEIYYKVQTRAATYGVDMTIVNALAPWYVAFTVGGISMDNITSDPVYAEYGVDEHFEREAFREGKPLIALEKSPERYNVWATLPVYLQEEFLEEVLQPSSRAQQILKEFTAAWERGDVEAMAAAQKKEYFSDDTSRYKKVEYQRLLVERNASWADLIEKEFMGGDLDYLIVGGAYHFTGPDSVLAQLESRGHKVERVEY